MSTTYPITLLSGAPPTPWQTGTLQLDVTPPHAQGTFQIPDEIDEPFSVKGFSAHELMDATFVSVKGANSKASVEIHCILMTNHYGTLTHYAGGMVNLLDYSIQEWLPYILNGSVAEPLDQGKEP